VQYPHFDPQSAVTPLTPLELQALDTLLQALPADNAMSLDGFDGYLTAFAVGPAALLQLPSESWLPLIWGGDEGADSSADSSADAAPFATKRQRKNTVLMALRHRRHLMQQLREAPQSWEPIFSIAEQGAQEWVDAREWCMGFLQAVDLMPEAWGQHLADPLLAPLLLLGGGLNDHDTPVDALDTDDPVACDELSRAVPEGVLQVLARLGA
jgi:uncharacterized protein